MIHDGYIVSTRGRGVFVCELETSQSDETTREAAALISDCVDACLELGLSTKEIHQLMSRRLQAQSETKTSEQGSISVSHKPGSEKSLRVLEGKGNARKQKSS
jgi:GntR family transcriptional regulator